MSSEQPSSIQTSPILKSKDKPDGKVKKIRFELSPGIKHIIAGGCGGAVVCNFKFN